MDFLREIVPVVFLLLLSCKLRDCYSVRCAGELTFDKDIIPIGSNLTVHCRSDTDQCNRPFIIQLNGETILQKNSCSSVTTQLVISQPKFRLICMVKQKEKLHLVCGRDIVADLIPSTPYIKKIVFAKGSLSATIHWQDSGDVELQKPKLRFRRTNEAGWTDGNVTQLHEGILQMLDSLEPLTSYQFELRVCTVVLKHNCSLWSQPVNQKSPGQAPSGKLDVWRVLTRNEANGMQNVTVLWKAFTSDSHKGDVLGYELVYEENGSSHTLNCSAAETQLTLWLPVGVKEVSVIAVTSAGNSPPAPVMLTYTGSPAPAVYLSPAAGGRIHLVWNSSDRSNSKTPEETTGFVVEWRCRSSEVKWKRIAKNQNSAFIDGAPPCTVSLYAESTEGVSHPAFGQIHLKGEKASANSGHKGDKNLSDSEALMAHPVVSAPTLAVEGPDDGVIIGICLMTAAPLVIIINLMYLKCARQRIRKACTSMGPSWLFENLPKLANSNAIKLLQDEKCYSDLSWEAVDTDPPLSPVEDFIPHLEMRNLYPVAHTEATTDERKAVPECAVCPYKPQISIPQEVEGVSEEAENDDDEHPWMAFSPDFNESDHEFFPSQGILGPLSSCLTVDGAPVSVNVVNGFLILTQSTLEEDIWRVEGDGTNESETQNGDETSYQGQTVLPSNLVKCLRDPSFNARCYSPQGASTGLNAQAALRRLQVDEHLL